MSLFNNKKRLLSFAGLILASFSIMAAFSIFLHDHELDPFAADEDCAPCQWTQISVNLDSGTFSPDFIPITFAHDTVVLLSPYKNFKHSYFGLSPPVFS